jgi:hypothetical protein
VGSLRKQEPAEIQKRKETHTCYFFPHPRTHKEPHKEGKQQSHTKGNESYCPHGKNQAQHWKRKMNSSVTIGEASCQRTFCFPNVKNQQNHLDFIFNKFLDWGYS